jgi:protein phosphatase
VVPEIRDYDVQAGDVYLLCSDGLPDMVEDEDIAMTLSSLSPNPDACAGRLVDMANEAGGRDNISVVLIKIRQAFPAARGWWARLLAWFK